MKKPTLIVITGPTASGKSALAVSLAQKLNTEIISADSRQIFQGIPIVTAVPTIEERGGVTHHLLEILPLDAYYSASQFEEDALELLAQIFEKHDTAIVCGGSMMYVDALCNGIDEIPTVPEELRSGLMQQWKELGDKWLLGELLRLDPVHFEKIDRRNMKRVFHAVEISLAAERPYSSLLTGKRVERPFNIMKFCLTGPRDVLFDRINRRVDMMVEAGLEEEARSVYDLRHLNSLNTVGLKEMFAMFDGTLPRDVAIERIKKNTRVYAKKQLTWHKRDTELQYLDFTLPLADNVKSLVVRLFNCLGG